jgi:hypothetical protein
MRPRRHPRRAVTLIEAVLFIAIALGLIIGGLVFYQQASTAQRTTETIRLITGLVSEVRAIEQQGLDAGLDIIPILKAAGAVPSNATLDGVPLNNVTACNMKSQWGGCIQFYNRAGSIGVFQLYLYAVPVNICARLAQFDQSGNGPLGDEIIGVEFGRLDSVGNGPVWDAHYLDPDGALTPAEGGRLCATHQTGLNDRRVMFLFRWR